MADDDVDAAIERSRQTIMVRSIAAARLIGGQVATKIKRRIRKYRPIGLNVQEDMRGETDPSQSVKSTNTAQGVNIEVLPHYERAGPAVRNVANSIDPEMMFREQLWVRHPSKSGPSGDPRSVDMDVADKGGARLQLWANREDKGEQVYRRALFVGADVSERLLRSALLLSPTETKMFVDEAIGD